MFKTYCKDTKNLFRLQVFRYKLSAKSETFWSYKHKNLIPRNLMVNTTLAPS